MCSWYDAIKRNHPFLFLAGKQQKTIQIVPFFSTPTTPTSPSTKKSPDLDPHSYVHARPNRNDQGSTMMRERRRMEIVIVFVSLL